MALEKTTTYKGVSSNYWKITNLVEDVVQGKTRVHVGLYKSSATRTSDVNNFLKKVNYVMEENDVTRADAYTHLKTLEDFDGATDA